MDIDIINIYLLALEIGNVIFGIPILIKTNDEWIMDSVINFTIAFFWWAFLLDYDISYKKIINK